MAGPLSTERATEFTSVGGVGNADGNSVKQQQSRTQSKRNSEEIPARTGRQATRQRAAGLSFAWATK